MDLISIAIFLISLDFLKKKNTLESSKKINHKKHFHVPINSYLCLKKMTLTEKDQQYLWHAYTQHKTSDTPIAITKGKDALLWDENGNTYIDAIASWWVNPYGRSN